MSWYFSIAAADLMQGDLLPALDIPVPVGTPAEFTASEHPPIEVITSDVIVLSQSCDLAQGKTDWVTVAQYERWELVSVGMGTNKRRSLQKQIRRGSVPHWALLNEDSPGLPWSIVDFRRLFTLPRAYLEAHAGAIGPRLRMHSPYREDVAQAFARYFMRVALPEDPVQFDDWDPQPPPPATPATGSPLGSKL